MTSLTAPFAAPRVTEAKERPKPQAPRPGPVLIYDSITPYAGETLLLAFWRTWDGADKDDN